MYNYNNITCFLVAIKVEIAVKTKKIHIKTI